MLVHMTGPRLGGQDKYGVLRTAITKPDKRICNWKDTDPQCRCELDTLPFTAEPMPPPPPPLPSLTPPPTSSPSPPPQATPTHFKSSIMGLSVPGYDPYGGKGPCYGPPSNITIVTAYKGNSQQATEHVKDLILQNRIEYARAHCFRVCYFTVLHVCMHLCMRRLQPCPPHTRTHQHRTLKHSAMHVRGCASMSCSS